jgi:type IV pilus assembly protein PilM
MAFGSKSVIGLDIGSRLVKALQVKKSGRGVELERFGAAEVFPGGDKTSASNGSLRDLQVQAIKRALQEANINAKFAVSAVSGESIIVRYIQLPEMPEAELKQALQWEAEEYIPFHIDEVNLDSVVLGPAGGGATGKVDVLLVSAKKDLVNEHVELVKSAGLQPMIVDVESFAFLNCFEMNYSPGAAECVALVNIGAEVTNINIYVGGTSRFSRDIGIAGDTITAAIQSKTGIPWRQAEELKIQIGAPAPEVEEEESGESSLIDTIRGTVEKMTGEDLGDDSPSGAGNKAVRQSLNNLIGEVRRSIQFFENQAGGVAVQKVMLGGGGSKMSRLCEYMHGELTLPVETMDPLRSMTISGREINTSQLEEYKQHLGVGIGLALRKVLD